ncbi:antitoxin [Georgenia sp. Z1491]|uniref:antitoxin n=1 Tax=Georgenia sp. Z1491 TaxID=3416707 RepID=UPI003CF8EDBC
MGIGDYLNKAKDALSGERGEQLLDKVEGAARKATGGKHDGMIDKARDAAGNALGHDDDRAREAGADGTQAAGNGRAQDAGAGSDDAPDAGREAEASADREGGTADRGTAPDADNRG